MIENKKICVIIPALDEEGAIGKVIHDIPDWIDNITVVDNGSTDRTMEVAAKHGAQVLHEPRQGYGQACLTGISALKNCDIVVFIDGDYSDYPQEMSNLLRPILDDKADMVIGSRALGQSEKGSLTIVQRFGNKLACSLIKLFWNVTYTDLGPFRAIRYSSLLQLEMADTNYGWTIEMQIKAALKKLRTTEVAVSYRARIGTSKISGTIAGSVKAGTKILSTIGFYLWKYGFKLREQPPHL